MKPTFFLTLLLIFLVETVSGDGKLWMKVVSFDNPGGLDDAGHDCDEILGLIIGSKCDPRFIICVDKANGGNNVFNCVYGGVDTGMIGEFNSRVFDSNRVGTMENPRTFAFSSWPGSVKIKIRILDVDDDDDDLIDYINTTFSGPLYPSYSELPANPSRVTIERRVKLVVDLFAYCDEDFYGPSCSTYCKAGSSQYTCYKLTGEKKCSYGWKGEDCHIRTDSCFSSPCEHGGGCENKEDGFTCHCPDGYAGSRCEIDINECQSNPCQNKGTCQEGRAAGYSCSCAQGWTGFNCENDVDECASTPCLNNGKCRNVIGSYVCKCPIKWTGTLCEIGIDDCENNPCYHYRICTDLAHGFTCGCSNGLTEKNCETDIDNCQGAVKPVRMLIKGYLHITEEEKLRENVEKIIEKQLSESPQTTKILLSPEYENTDDVSAITKVDVAVYLNNIQMCERKLHEMLDKYLHTLPWPAKIESSNFDGNSVDPRSNLKGEIENWISRHLYVVVIVAGLLIVFVIVATIMIHKRKARPEVGEHHNSANHGLSQRRGLPPPPEVHSDELNKGDNESYDDFVLQSKGNEGYYYTLNCDDVVLQSMDNEGFYSTVNCAEEGAYSEVDDKCTDDYLTPNVKCVDGHVYLDLKP